MFFWSGVQLSKCEETAIKVCEDEAERSSHICLLGTWLDEQLSMKHHHITCKCRVAMFNIQWIKYIRPYLISEACKTLVSSLVMSHLDYTNSHFYGLPKCDIGHLQRVQNCAAKLVLNRSKYESHTQAFIDLHWLPLRQWIEHKILSINKTALQYLIDLIHWKEAGRYGLWSGDSHRLLKIPATKRKISGNHSFSVGGPKVWNSLPDYLRLSPTIDKFKKDLRLTFSDMLLKLWLPNHILKFSASHIYNHYHIKLCFHLMLL